MYENIYKIVFTVKNDKRTSVREGKVVNKQCRLKLISEAILYHRRLLVDGGHYYYLHILLLLQCEHILKQIGNISYQGRDTH